ncbi:cation:proton antiporter [Methanocaldococcus infernus]
MDLYAFFFIIMSIIFIVPNLLKKFRIPSITSLILAGIIIGPYGLNILQVDETLKAFGKFGAIMLMFLAGLEVDNETLKNEFKNSLILTFFSITIPGIGGYIVGKFLGLDFLGSLLLTVIFASHSVAIVYSLLDELNLTKSRLGTLILSSTVTTDLLTLLLLSVVIKLKLGGEIGSFVFLTFFYIIILLLLIPLVSKYILKLFEKLHAQRIHFVLFILFISILAGELLGLHPIVGSFISGLAISEALTKEEHDKLLNKNLNAIGYGFFIPIFFLKLGMEVNIRAINFNYFEIIFIIIVSSIILKFLSGYIALKLLKYDKRECIVGAMLTIPKISASLVAAYIGLNLNIINESIFISIIALSVISSTLIPTVLKNYLKGGLI